MSNLAFLRDARGKTTSFTYDNFNRLATVTYPGTPALSESFLHDAAGRLQTRTDRKAVVTTYGYDTLGRLTGKTYSDGTPAVTYGYDAVGRLLSSANGTDSLTWSYDLAGQMRSETSAKNGSVVAYTYDRGSNRKTLSLDGSQLLTYDYDNASRLVAITRGTSSFTFDYDDASRRTSVQFPNQVTASYDYDVVSRLTNLKTTLGAQTLTQSAYILDDAGNRLVKYGDYREFYTYDALDRVFEVQHPQGTTTEQYTYDAVGNRLTSLSGPTWIYDDGNRLLDGGGATFGYDFNGNLTSRTDSAGTWAYEWNAENQLIRVFFNGSERSRFAYDPLGRRVDVRSTRPANTLPVTMTYDGAAILRAFSGTTSTAKRATYVHGPRIDELLAKGEVSYPPDQPPPATPGTLTYYHADGIGSITRTTRASGSVTSSVRYDAFGSLLQGTANLFGFTGRELDAASELYYYRARYYDPKIGRFISEDPIRWLGGLNLYLYVRDNPVNHIDPSGLLSVNQAACLSFWTLAGGLGGMEIGGAVAAPGGITIPMGMAAGGAMGATAGYAAGLTICRIPPPTTTCSPRVIPFPQPGQPPKRKCYFVGMATEFGEIGCVYDCRPGRVFYQSDTGCPPIMEF